jgi:predicted PurR-regulated permease PerM
MSEHRTQVERRFVFGLVLVITLLFVWMIHDFLAPLFLAALSSGLMTPVYRRLLFWMGGRQTLAALATLIIAVAIIVGPLSLFLGILVNEARQVTETVVPFVQKQLADPRELESRIPEWLPFRDQILPYRVQITERLGEAAGKVGGFLVKSASAATQGTANFLLDLFIMLYAMFFFLTQGRAIIDTFLASIPMARADQELMMERGVSVTRAMIKGSLVIGALQGALAGIAFWIVGIQGAVFWATVMAVASLIPGIGAALVWIPGVVYLFAVGKIGGAIFLAAWCAAVVGSVDNVLRPWLVGQDTKMPDLLILLSTLGGLGFFGAIGLIVGPIVAALFMTVLGLYQAAFADVLSDEREA